MNDMNAARKGDTATRTDEPMATVAQHFDKSEMLCDWERLSDDAKEECIRDLLDDPTLRELIEIRDSLRKIHLADEVDENTEEMLQGVFETVDVMITNHICTQCCDDSVFVTRQ